MSDAVNTKNVTGRRQLRFQSLDDALADAEMLALASRIRTLGNWTPGQVFKHLAIGLNSQIDGIPLHPPWIIRIMGRYFFKKRIITKGMLAGFQLPKESMPVMVPPATTTVQEGLESLHAAVKRLNADHTRVPSPFLGPLTEDESNKVQCRHAELHLSFLVPEN